MKRLLLVVVMVLAMAGVARADSLSIGEELSKLPGLKQGVAYSIQDNEIKYCFTIETIKWNNLALEVGYIPEDAAIAAITYKLLALKDLGVTVPILDLIDFRAGIYGGYKSVGIEGENNFDYGATLTAISFHF